MCFKMLLQKHTIIKNVTFNKLHVYFTRIKNKYLLIDLKDFRD